MDEAYFDYLHELHRMMLMEEQRAYLEQLRSQIQTEAQSNPSRENPV